MIPRHDPEQISFASDNYSGAHPEVLAALAVANGGHQTSYGADAYTAALPELFAPLFGEGIEVYPVWNGTGANVVGLMSLTDRWSGVVCSDMAHINTDEGGAPERVGGLKLLAVPTPDGKLTPELVDRVAIAFEDEHRARPTVLSLTQSTELGTVYTPAEVTALAAHAHGLGMSVQMDGARIANAAASLGVPVRAFTRDAGVDVLSFGGTKNGMVFGEALVVLNPAVVRGVLYLRKLTTQLSSKTRFISAQLEALLTDDLWLRGATHANAMAARLAAAIEGLPGIELTAPVQANGVFPRLPRAVVEATQQRFGYYLWDESDPQRPVARWMCTFDTTEADVDAFAAAVRESARPS
ncbi:threonine aldolase family protein [Nocardioides sp.]|uniref:threonine aldolase family protein n=1 Tax=Nocardioides sp. TaxID=35761 RepID=UPI0039E27F7A